MARLKIKVPITAFIDGASRGNPGPAALGVVFQDEKGRVVKKLSLSLGIATNNTAEYYALIFALQEAMILGVRDLKVYTDSELVAKQFTGEYKIKEPSLKLLFSLVEHLRQGFRKITVTPIAREHNKLADREANRALDHNPFFL